MGIDNSNVINQLGAQPNFLEGLARTEREVSQEEGQGAVTSKIVGLCKSLQSNNFGDYNLPREMVRHIFSYLEIKDLFRISATSKSFNVVCRELLYKHFLESSIRESIIEKLIINNAPPFILEYYLNANPNAIMEYESKNETTLLFLAILFEASPQSVGLLLQGGAKITVLSSRELSKDVIVWAMKYKPCPKIMKSLLEVYYARIPPGLISSFSIEEMIALSDLYKDWDDLKYALTAYRLGLDDKEVDRWVSCKIGIFNGFISSEEKLLDSWYFKNTNMSDHENIEIRKYITKIKNEVLYEALKKGFCAESIQAIIERGATVDEKMVSFAISNNVSPGVMEVLHQNK